MLVTGIRCRDGLFCLRLDYGCPGLKRRDRAGDDPTVMQLLADLSWSLYF